MILGKYFNFILFYFILYDFLVKNLRVDILLFHCTWIELRENAQLSKYGDTTSARNILVTELKRLIEANPLFQDKLTFPSIKASRLRTLINQR